LYLAYVSSTCGNGLDLTFVGRALFFGGREGEQEHITLANKVSQHLSIEYYGHASLYFRRLHIDFDNFNENESC